MVDNEPFYIDHLGNEFNSDGTKFVRVRKQFDNEIYFYGGIPSNFYIASIWLPDPIYGDVLEWQANEQYFQVSKLKYHEAATRNQLNEFIAAGSPREAKRLGRNIPLTEEELAIWNFTGALTAMMECNMAKYTTHERCWEWLDDTEDKILIEHSKDKIWGDGLDGTGRNLLGWVLMIVRAKLR